MTENLSDIEDSALAIGEDDYVSVMLAQSILSQWYNRRIIRNELICILDRLARLGLIKWYVVVGRRKYFRKRLKRDLHRNGSVLFTATMKGKSLLAEPRKVKSQPTQRPPRLNVLD